MPNVICRVWRSRRSLDVAMWTATLISGVGLWALGGMAGAAGVAAAVPGASSGLPDGRAWEMVSPLDKNGGEIDGIENGGVVRRVEGDAGGGIVQASPDGEAITYVSRVSFAEPRGASTGSQYLSRRREVGWLTRNITTPTNSQSYPIANRGTPYPAFSTDLSTALLFGGSRGTSSENQPVESPPLAPGAPVGYEDYYLGALSDGLNALPDGALVPLLTQTPSVLPGEFNLEFLGATPDLGHVVLLSQAALSAGAIEVPGDSNLYEWERATGQFQPINVLPDGEPDPRNTLRLGSFKGGSQAISEDGSRVIWSAASNLYVRENIGSSQPSTVRADAPSGGGVFLIASADARKVFFGDRSPLTPASAAGGGVGDLYRFEPEAPEGSRLADLTIDRHGDPRGAEVQGVLGASADGSYVYFVANGVLDLHAPGISLGSCTENAIGPKCNLYLWHEGWKEPKFIAAVTSGDSSGGGFNTLGVAFDWSPETTVRTARVSHDGMRLVFMSEESLTGYDNPVSTGGHCGAGLTARCQEVYLYEAGADEASSGHLSCVSCNPSGARPIGPSGIPGGTDFSLHGGLYESRVISEEVPVSRVFFDSADALVPRDTNGTEDVYEYEDGRPHLLSDGTSTEGASFVDASVKGDDAFFVTRGQLVPQDTDQLVDLYDARAPHAPGEKVGFPVTAPVVCEGEDCRAAGLAAPLFAAPASNTFAGLGNVPAPAVSKPVVKAKVKRAKPKRRKKKRARGKKARTQGAHGTTRGRK